MSKIDYQALREAAEAIKIAATPQKLLAFRMKVTPQVVLALLDERERNQQYIKRRDQENEDIALTVGRLRVELEGKDSKIANLTAERDALREGEMTEVRAQAFNDLCSVFVKDATVAGLDDGDTLTLKEVTEALLHYAEQLRAPE